MKKIFAMLLIAAMLLSLCACAVGTKDTNLSNALTQIVNEYDEIVSDSGSIRGSVSGNTYVNEAIGLQCELGSEWEIYNEEMLAQVAGLTTDVIANESVQQSIENGNTVFDFYAAKDGGYSTINVNITLGTASGLSEMSEKELLETAIAEARSTLEASGFENLNMELETLTFAGETHYAVSLTATISDMPIYERMLMFVAGKYLYTLTTCSIGENTAGDYLECFSAIN